MTVRTGPPIPDDLQGFEAEHQAGFEVGLRGEPCPSVYPTIKQRAAYSRGWAKGKVAFLCEQTRLRNGQEVSA